MPQEAEVTVRVPYRRHWLWGLAKAVLRWRWLFNVLLWLAPVEAYVGSRLLARWRVRLLSDHSTFECMEETGF